MKTFLLAKSNVCRRSPVAMPSGSASPAGNTKLVQLSTPVLLLLGLWQWFLHYRIATEPHPLVIHPPDQQMTTYTTTAPLSGDGQLDPIEQHCSQQPPEFISKSCARRQTRLTLPTSVPEEPREQHCSQLPPILGPTNCSTFSRRQTP